MSSRETWFESSCLTVELSHVSGDSGFMWVGCVLYLLMLKGRKTREQEQLESKGWRQAP